MPTITGIDKMKFHQFLLLQDFSGFEICWTTSDYSHRFCYVMNEKKNKNIKMVYGNALRDTIYSIPADWRLDSDRTLTAFVCDGMNVE